MTYLDQFLLDLSCQEIHYKHCRYLLSQQWLYYSIPALSAVLNKDFSKNG